MQPNNMCSHIITVIKTSVTLSRPCGATQQQSNLLYNKRDMTQTTVYAMSLLYIYLCLQNNQTQIMSLSSPCVFCNMPVCRIYNKHISLVIKEIIIKIVSII